MIYCRICMPLTHSNCCYSWISHLLRFALIYSKQMLGNKSTKVCEKLLFKCSSVCIHNWTEISWFPQIFREFNETCTGVTKTQLSYIQHFFYTSLLNYDYLLVNIQKKCLILNFIILIIHTWPLFLFVNG